MMGVLPLQFQQGESAEALGLDGKEEISVDINEDVQPHDLVNVTAKMVKSLISKLLYVLIH